LRWELTGGDGAWQLLCGRGSGWARLVAALTPGMQLRAGVALTPAMEEAVEPVNCPHPGFATPLPLAGRGELGGVGEVWLAV